MGARQQVLLQRRIQFVVLLVLVVASIFFLASSDLGSGNVFGIPMKAVFGLAGMALLIAVAFAAQKILFSNLPAKDEGNNGYDPIRQVDDIASPKSLGRLAELKYGEHKECGRDVAFERVFDRKD
jgi:hypothetical protein